MQIAAQTDKIPMMQEVRSALQTQGQKGAVQDQTQHILLKKHRQQFKFK